MERPNIQLSVAHAEGLAHKLYCAKKLLSRLDGCGLIYCATRENTVLVTEYLQQQGISVAAYHAGFPASTKQKIQQDFLKNAYQVIVATNALGMGIDKADLRFVIHFDVPSSITAYYQEVGRAGRDGLPARGILLFDISDKKIQDHFIDSAQPSATDFTQVLEIIQKTKPAPGLTEIKRLTGLHPTRVTVVIAELIEQAYIAKSSQQGKQVYSILKKQDSPDLSRYQNQHQLRQQELAGIIHYAEQRKICWMQLLRAALGDHIEKYCGHCDVCLGKFISIRNDHESLKDIDIWLQQRLTVIDAIKTYKTEAGVSVLDGKLHSSLFIHFMQQRKTISQQSSIPLFSELLELLKRHLRQLQQQYHFDALLVIPSRTWAARAALAKWMADKLHVSLFLDYLYWREIPSARQGELLNNDQRRYNVNQHMTYSHEQRLPAGTLLLLDDYLGSGATLTEAARVLRKEAGFQGKIVPFTIAQVKWRLGRSGMI
jgi:ATP-dependent DNA helicase RecQ